jgi:hypothetical protein
MSLRLRSLILAITFSLGAVFPAEAKTYRCDALFQPTVGDVLDQLNSSNANFLFQAPSFREYTESLSWMRKRKIRKLVRDLEVRSFPSEKFLERYTIELNTALFGTHNSLRQWMTKSSEERLDDSAVLLIKEQLLKEGLLKTWGDVYDPQQISFLKRTIDQIQTFQHSRLLELIRFPFVLPSMKNKTLSDELIFKVIRDGFNAHAEEIRVALHAQTKIDAYNTFRKVYAPVFFSVMLFIQAQNAYQQLQDTIEQQVKQTIENLRNQRKQIAESIPKLKQEEFDRAYVACIEEFKQKWGEPPTAEEDAQIRVKIQKALKMPVTQ